MDEHYFCRGRVDDRVLVDFINQFSKVYDVGGMTSFSQNRAALYDWWIQRGYVDEDVGLVFEGLEEAITPGGAGSRLFPGLSDNEKSRIRKVILKRFEQEVDAV
ncbi:MAG: hypothetical protein KKF56_00855 [Nanoarchaeota archaeon]|nr:hypothetical protein [Nanoarchaeota archaeon]